MKDRIKEIRKDSGLTMEKFGEKISINRSSVSLLESGRNKPSQQTVFLICKEFGVNEEWLRTGEGEKYTKLEVDDYAAVAAEIAKGDQLAQKAIVAYWKLSGEDKQLFWDFVNTFILKED